jgi:two-component system NtrC family sensor kinase
LIRATPRNERAEARSAAGAPLVTTRTTEARRAAEPALRQGREDSIEAGEGAAPTRGAGAGARPGPRRLSTKGRLYVAFALLAASFAAAFAQQIATLNGMRRALATMDELDEGKRLALEIEHETRIQFGREVRIAAGDAEQIAIARSANGHLARLAAELQARVAGAEPKARAAAMEAATRELDRVFEEAIASVATAEQKTPERLHEATYRLVYDVEENADALIALLQEEDVKQCAVVERVRSSTLGLAILFLLGFPVLTGAFALQLSRSVARPLRVIGEGAARIAAGDLGTRIDAGGPEEFDVLASQVNAMAARLKRDQEELVRAETLAGLGRMAAGIAHEINNPLQVMLGYVSLHRDRAGGTLGRDLERMAQEATRCKTIVDSLLQLARPPVARPAMPVDLREVSMEVAGALRVAMNGHAAPVRVLGEGTALGSPLTVRQILVNLARNAMEAAGPDGAVEIRVSTDESRAIVSVSDTGPGIPPEHQHRIFDPFFTTKGTGTGLGLSMARSIAGALGGDLALEPGGCGGACFTLRLPLAAPGERT